MKRCSAIAAWRAVKELRRATAHAGVFKVVFDDCIAQIESVLAAANGSEFIYMLDEWAMDDVIKRLDAIRDGDEIGAQKFDA